MLAVLRTQRLEGVAHLFQAFCCLLLEQFLLFFQAAFTLGVQQLMCFFLGLEFSLQPCLLSIKTFDAVLQFLLLSGGILAESIGLPAPLNGNNYYCCQSQQQQYPQYDCQNIHNPKYRKKLPFQCSRSA